MVTGNSANAILDYGGRFETECVGTDLQAGRRYFIGGSDARIMMGADEGAPFRLWREKRGEVEPEDLSGNLFVHLGLVTEPLNRHWYERNTGRPALRPDHFSAHERLFVGFDFKRSPETHSGPSPVLVDKLHAGRFKSAPEQDYSRTVGAQNPLLCLEALYRRQRNRRCLGKIALLPTQ